MLNIIKLDTTIALRAFGIFAIVSNHFHFISLWGATYFLIFLSGYNFVKFTLPKLDLTEKHFDHVQFTKSYFRFLFKLVLPVVLYLGFIYLFLGRPNFAGLFLISNYFGPNYGDGLSLWFVEVLVQIYLLFALVMYSNNFYFWIRKNQWLKFASIFVISSLLSVMFRLMWDTTELMDRLPHLLFYLFAAGCMVAESKSSKQKLYASLLITISSVEFIYLPLSDKHFFYIFGVLISIWVSYIYIPKIVGTALTKVAMASLFIYMSHFQAKSLLEKLYPGAESAIYVLFAIVVGVIMSYCWKNRHRFISKTKLIIK